MTGTPLATVRGITVKVGGFRFEEWGQFVSYAHIHVLGLGNLLRDGHCIKQFDFVAPYISFSLGCEFDGHCDHPF